MMSSGVIASPTEIRVAESADAKLIGASPLQIWCSRSRAGMLCPWGIQRSRPWSQDPSSKLHRLGPPRLRFLRYDGCRGHVRCAGPSCRPGRGVIQRGRDKPRDDRTNTSYSGHEASMFCSDMFLGSNQVTVGSICLTTSLFFGIGGGCFTHPGTVFVCFTTVLQTLDVAGAVALHDGHEFVPVQFTEVVVTTFFVPLQVWVRQGQAQCLGLRDNHVHEALTELIVGKAFNVPSHRLLGVRGVIVRWTKHLQCRAIETVHRILCHGFLFWGAVGEFVEDFPT